MNATNTLHQEKSSAALVASSILALPAAVAFGAALSLAHGVGSLFSAQWFIYEVSRQVALVGMAITLIMIATLALGRARRATIAWMLIIVASSAVFLWWAHDLATIF